MEANLTNYFYVLIEQRIPFLIDFYIVGFATLMALLWPSLRIIGVIIVVLLIADVHSETVNIYAATTSFIAILYFYFSSTMDMKKIPIMLALSIPVFFVTSNLTLLHELYDANKLSLFKLEFFIAVALLNAIIIWLVVVLIRKTKNTAN